VTPSVFSPTGIRFENIDKRYGGLYALRRVSLDISAGECVAFAGRNGSGKTTLLRIAACLVRPSSGSVSFLDRGKERGGTLPPAGFVAHATMVYDELFARLQGIAEPAARAEALLREVGLLERRSSLVRTFSRGMRQRVAIARALLNEPAVVLLDEPTTGLDPQGAHWFAETLRHLRDSGRTILMSLHGESEVSTLATRAIQLDAGAVVADTRTGANFRSVLAFANA